MTTPPPSTSPPVYHEPAARYTSSWILAAFVVVGFAVDSARAGHVAHLLGWVIGGVLIVGINVLIVHAARTMRSITVTSGDIRVGEQWVERAHLAGIDRSDDTAHVLGQTPHTALPRGVPGLRLRLVNGEVTIVPTRRPHALESALGLGESSRRGEPDVVDVHLATPDELDALGAIAQRAATLYRVAELDAPPDTTAAGLATASAVLVAGAPAVGFIQLDRDGDVVRVSTIAVLPARMRHGIGGRLLEAAAEWAVAQGAGAFTAVIDERASWQRPFFAGCGFTGDDAELRRDLAR